MSDRTKGAVTGRLVHTPVNYAVQAYNAAAQLPKPKPMEPIVSSDFGELELQVLALTISERTGHSKVTVEEILKELQTIEYGSTY